MIYNAIEDMGLEERNEAVPANPTPAPVKLISNHPHSPTIIKSKLGEKNTKYTVIFNVHFSSEDSVIELIDCYNYAIAGDKFEILIQSPGGSVPTLMNIIEAMKTSKAKTKAIVYGMAASCGALLWLWSDEQEMLPGTGVMFHSTGQMMMGKSLDIIDDASATVEYVKAIMAPAVEKGYLTEEEFMEMFKLKKDIWISYDEFVKRTTAPTPEPKEEEGGDSDV